MATRNYTLQYLVCQVLLQVVKTLDPHPVLSEEADAALGGILQSCILRARALQESKPASKFQPEPEPKSKRKHKGKSKSKSKSSSSGNPHQPPFCFFPVLISAFVQCLALIKVFKQRPVTLDRFAHLLRNHPLLLNAIKAHIVSKLYGNRLEYPQYLLEYVRPTLLTLPAEIHLIIFEFVFQPGHDNSPQGIVAANKQLRTETWPYYSAYLFLGATNVTRLRHSEMRRRTLKRFRHLKMDFDTKDHGNSASLVDQSFSLLTLEQSVIYKENRFETITVNIAVSRYTILMGDYNKWSPAIIHLIKYSVWGVRKVSVFVYPSQGGPFAPVQLRSINLVATAISLSLNRALGVQALSEVGTLVKHGVQLSWEGDPENMWDSAWNA